MSKATSKMKGKDTWNARRKDKGHEIAERGHSLFRDQSRSRAIPASIRCLQFLQGALLSLMKPALDLLVTLPDTAHRVRARSEGLMAHPLCFCSLGQISE